jgi:hypothetical protein
MKVRRKGEYHRAMVVNPQPEPIDPIDEEIARALADPAIRRSLEEFIERDRRGELGPGISTDEVRRRLGMPPREMDDEIE